MKFTPFLEYVLYNIFGQSELVTARSMMGAYILYYEGKAFAIVEKEELYFKGNKELASWYLERGGKQFGYTTKRKEAHLYYFLVPVEIYENTESRNEWLDVALSVAKLPKARQ